jgi:proliferating cell nuclear antigen PCNA
MRTKQEAPDINIIKVTDENYVPMSESIILEAATCQTNAFKLIIEALKEALKDINIKWIKPTPGIADSGGMSIVAYNPRSAVLIKVKIPASSFDKFYINPPNEANEIQIGVNMKSFNTIMKMGRNNDGTSLILNEHDKNELTFIFENGETNYRSRYNLKLLELPDEGIHLPTTQFPFKIIILSDDFHKIIRDQSYLSDKINIKFINTKEIQNTIVFSSKGDFADGEITLTDATEGVQIIKNMEENEEIIVKGTYDLKNLSLFSKCQTLCGCVELYLKNNFPLIIKYQVANLGHVLLVLSTCGDDNGLEEDDSSEEEN